MNQLLDRHLKGDRTIWVVALLLGITSLLAVYSASSWMGWRDHGGTFRILVKHALMLAGAGGIMYASSRLRYTVYSKLAQIFLWATVALLVLTLLIGTNVNGASRWLAIPGVGITFQTSDLARVVIIAYLARVLGRQHDEPWTFRDVLLRLLLPVGAVCGAILPANFSTAALLLATCMVLMFIGRVPVKHLLGICGMAASAFGLLLLLSKANPDLLPRLQTWQSRLENHGGSDRDANYQVNKAKIAIVHGGFLPNGPGTGTSRNYMPHPESDMIYAFIIEEYGSILGGLGLLLLYLILLSRAMRIANRCDRPFGSLVAVGLALSLVMQALVNMAVGVNLVPVTGQPLPLVSMGGTSMWFTCLSIGIILSVSRSVYDAQAAAKSERPATTAHAA
ncbi:MAG: FtsW/RodA/SpoVE family cell cycle protein [Flavobacteriales bacterium]|nr:FtsW/RodA/SpoVE family cell cycle protein [Flavobacteriales bacterium]